MEIMVPCCYIVVTCKGMIFNRCLALWLLFCWYPTHSTRCARSQVRCIGRWHAVFLPSLHLPCIYRVFSWVASCLFGHQSIPNLLPLEFRDEIEPFRTAFFCTLAWQLEFVPWTPWPADEFYFVPIYNCKMTSRFRMRKIWLPEIQIPKLNELVMKPGPHDITVVLVGSTCV